VAVAREADLEGDPGEARAPPEEIERAQEPQAIQMLVEGPARDLPPPAMFFSRGG
jgi:hypothetical protein